VRAAARAWFALGVTAFIAAACDVGQSAVTGIDEPVMIQGGQFISGELPGSPPLAPDQKRPTEPDGGFEPLSLLSARVQNPTIVAGLSGLLIGGDVSDDTQAVGIRFPDIGSGYWVVPAGSPDTQTPGAFSYSAIAGFSLTDPPGPHKLRLVAIGSSGNAGTQFELPVCLDSPIPDNGHACDPTVAPPSAVFSLTWDTNFDVDMHVVLPGGAVYDSKMRVGEPLEAGATKIPPDQPYIDRDSLANCVPDGRRQEDLVFPGPLAKGNYFLFVTPYSACGQNAVHFTFTIYESVGKCPACNLQAKVKQSGELLASQATDDMSPPTFVTELQVP
jgi:hypothetical protein